MGHLPRTFPRGLWCRPARLTAAALLAAGFSLPGCAHTPCACGRGSVSSRVEARTGYRLGPVGPVRPDGGAASLFLPNGASLDNGLAEDEAVLVALWNNAALLERLTELGIAHGDLVQAGLLPNPELIYFFPVPNKPFKFAVEFPIESLWLRPIRVKAAAAETERVCDALTQAGLDLIRDTRQAYADVLLARWRLEIAEEAVRIRGGIAQLAEARLEAGDISRQEATTARIDALAARQDAVRLAYEVAVAEERLRNLLGLGGCRRPLRLREALPHVPAATDVDALTAEALASRPDALAAARAADAAAERLRLSRIGWVRFLGLADASSGRKTGHELGPAFRVTLPIFNWNQGTVARAEAELERAVRARTTLYNQVILDVHQAHLRLAQARAELEVLDRQVRPEAEAAIRRAERAYRDGDTSYIVVLETTRQLLDSRLRQAQLLTDLRRARADLERSVGRRLDGITPDYGPPTGPVPALGQGARDKLDERDKEDKGREDEDKPAKDKGEDKPAKDASPRENDAVKGPQR